MSDIGVIQEQGFAMGNGLGFSPISEDLQPKDDNKDDNNEEYK